MCIYVCVYVCMYVSVWLCVYMCYVCTWLHASSWVAVSASISSRSASMSAFSMTLASCVSVSSVLVTWSSSVSSSTSCWYRVSSSLWDERARLRSDFSCSTALWWFWIWWRRWIKLQYDENTWKWYKMMRICDDNMLIWCKIDEKWCKNDTNMRACWDKNGNLGDKF